MDKNKEIKKRLEVMNEALQTAMDAILEIQTEYKLISYLVNKKDDET